MHQMLCGWRIYVLKNFIEAAYISIWIDRGCKRAIQSFLSAPVIIFFCCIRTWKVMKILLNTIGREFKITEIDGGWGEPPHSYLFFMMKIKKWVGEKNERKWANVIRREWDRRVIMCGQWAIRDKSRWVR